ncbi:MAG: inositol monophosphatase [Roseovarius sp.]|nr:inositol monophosphatase [Roseovarius sp.]
MTDLTELARHAARISQVAASVAMDHFRNPLNVEFKSDDSPVTQADKAVESVVRDYLGKHFPDDGIFGEEQGAEGLDNRYVWVIDPIDGTRSFLSGYPLFGFLLSLLEDGQSQIGVVGMPALSEVYIGVAGQGATMNGDPIVVSGRTRLDQAILFVNEGDKIFDQHPQVFSRLMQAGQTRRFAYDCYPHALLSAGYVDAVVDYDLQPYDYLAVSALIKAAGGVVTDWDGEPLTLASDGRVVSAATPELHQEVLTLINQ